MRISCVLAARELNPDPVDLIVLPEGICVDEINGAHSSHPDAVIVGAVVENCYSRGVLLHRGINQIDYRKVGSDGRTKGTANVHQNPVYELGDICIGVIICMDVNHGVFLHSITQTIRSSGAALKILCVPADMGGEWFAENSLAFPQNWEGIHVIVCNNNTRNHQAFRCKSFVTDTRGVKIVVQNGIEPIHAEL